MLAGIFASLGRLTAATRGLAKISLGLNPNQPLEWRSWLAQFSLGGGGGGGERSEGLSSGASQSIMDNMSRGSAQTYRQLQDISTKKYP